MRVKYGFTDEEPRRRVVTLMADIMNELARDEGANNAAVRWNTYEASRAQRLGDMDEALFEVAHLVADLTRVDGTVVMTDRLIRWRDDGVTYWEQVARGLWEV